ncbi:prolyl oligopeptidase family serine peptidase [Pseudonocardia benzenivorans]
MDRLDRPRHALPGAALRPRHRPDRARRGRARRGRRPRRAHRAGRVRLRRRHDRPHVRHPAGRRTRRAGPDAGHRLRRLRHHPRARLHPDRADLGRGGRRLRAGVAARGGEEGEAWHLAGNRANKQNVFDDLHSACERLVADGVTSPDRLAITGGSNGGLLVGAALTQRPDLYRAVVCSAPLLDMVRYEEFSLGRTWNDEYGTAADPTELGWLLSYSPYHHVHTGTTYPAVLFTVFESDTRVDPLHARKMCAALQHATAGDPDTRPVLIRRETDVGHAGRSISRTVALAVDQLAFLAAHTGLELT